MSDQATNHLALEPLLIDWLKTEIVQPNPQFNLRAVLSEDDLAGMAESDQPTPALHVIYLGDTQGENGGWYQIWVVGVAVRRLRTATEARQEAGPILAAVAHKAKDWWPGAGYANPKLKPLAKPLNRNGYAYFPVSLHIQVLDDAIYDD